MNLAKFVKPYLVGHPGSFRLSQIKPHDTGGLDIHKKEANNLLQSGIEQLSELQERLYADDRWSVLLIFQAMDAAGKDSAIKHVMSGINPQGCEVHSFKQPSAEELDHDFLWRAARHLPERGRIGIFNRSYYEEVLVARVHQQVLADQNLPPSLVTKNIWKERMDDIRSFERHLLRNGTIVLKFFLHVSKEEQKKRFLERIDTPSKNWKFSMNDVKERQHWRQYQRAYEDMIRHTSHPDAPWCVAPADSKWFTRLVVGARIVSAMSRLDLHFPSLSPSARRELAKARKILLAEN
ncbi:polyphosphate kinase 2 family protein [Bradyrhizobium sp. RDM12]